MSAKTQHLKQNQDHFLPESVYDTLVSEVKKQGYFSQTNKTFFFLFFLHIIVLLGSVAVVITTNTLWVQILNAIVMGFLTVQLGILGHDLSHQSVFRSETRNFFSATVIWGLGCGLSESRWFKKHNAHHQSPNHIGHDPDVGIPFVFDESQAANLTPWQKKYLLPHQHIFFWVSFWFVYPYNMLNSTKHIFHKPNRHTMIELFLMAGHFVLVFGFTFWFLPPMTALLFNLVVIATTGLYMALIFAPNHKGEDMLKTNQEPNWVHQITLTRNIYPSPIITYLFGSLNYQIEHHLFPTMSRFQYPKVQKIVKSFCQKQNLPYHETSWLESLRIINRELKKNQNSRYTDACV